MKSSVSKKDSLIRNIEDITADFKSMPIFEPVSKAQNGIDKKSLNDKLKIGSIHIGLNDKIAFIKHLFNGKNEDYERSEEHTSELQSRENLVCRLLLEKKK